MAENLNTAALIGRLTREVEVKKTQAGKSVANYSIACGRRKRHDEEGAVETDYFNAVTWNKDAEYLANYTQKGSKILIKGRLQNRSYENKDGNKITVTEIITDYVEILDGKAKQTEQNLQAQTYAAPQQFGNPQYGGFPPNYGQPNMPQTQYANYGNQNYGQYQQPADYGDLGYGSGSNFPH